jgi:hypothetical protein
MTRNAKAMQTKSKTHEVTHLTGDTYTVKSGSSKNEYKVTVSGQGATCSCEWSKYRPANDRRSGCSHVISVINYIEAGRGRKVSAWASEDDARRQRRPQVNIGDGILLTSRKAA